MTTTDRRSASVHELISYVKPSPLTLAPEPGRDDQLLSDAAAVLWEDTSARVAGIVEQ
jgi:hypothetical protein